MNVQQEIIGPTAGLIVGIAILILGWILSKNPTVSSKVLHFVAALGVVVIVLRAYQLVVPS